MPKSKKAVPEGLNTLTPQLVVKDAHAVFAFIEATFGAKPAHLMKGPDGKSVIHAHVRIGDSTLFVSDAGGFAKPTSANLFVYVEDVDGAVAKATAAGAKVLAPVSDMFWGDRWGMLEDPSGNVWQIATHVEDVPPEEMAERMKQMAPPR